MIDASRHFMPVDMVKRNLDGMAAVKMNVLHWHLSDDQGFRVECRTWPRLHKLGSDGLYYTQDQIRDVIAYAADRGIRVMPEFDIPGHSTSWLAAYPEYAGSAGPFAIERRFGIFDPTFNPALEKTYAFLDAFIKEMAALFPDPYFHIGGDEVSGVEWNNSPAIAAFKKKHGFADNAALHAYFNTRILRSVTRYGKKMVGWDEIFQPGLPKDIVIHSWRGREAMIESAKKGYRSLLSNGYYIDLCQPAFEHYLNDPIAEDAPLTEDAEEAHPGRRGDDVGGARHPGDRGFAHLAADGGHRREVLVAAGGQGRGGHVSPHGDRQPPARGARPQAPQLSGHAAPPPVGEGMHGGPRRRSRT